MDINEPEILAQQLYQPFLIIDQPLIHHFSAIAQPGLTIILTAINHQSYATKLSHHTNHQPQTMLACRNHPLPPLDQAASAADSPGRCDRDTEWASAPTLHRCKALKPHVAPRPG